MQDAPSIGATSAKTVARDRASDQDQSDTDVSDSAADESPQFRYTWQVWKCPRFDGGTSAGKDSGRMKTRSLRALARRPEWREFRDRQGRRLTTRDMAVLDAIVDCAAPIDTRRYVDGRIVVAAYVGQRHLADTLGVSIGTVKRAMARLSEAGHLARTRTYRLNSVSIVEFPPPTSGRTSAPSVGSKVRRQWAHKCADSSGTVTSPTEKSPSGNDYDARVLSAACDADAGNKAATPPAGINVQAVRRTLTELGVNPQTLPTIEARHKPETIAGVAQAVMLVKRERPNSKTLNDQAATGAMIGGMLLKGNQFPAWMREAIENANASVEIIERTLDRLEAADLIAER